MIYRFNNTFHASGMDYVEMNEVKNIIFNLINAGDLLERCSLKPFDQLTEMELHALDAWAEAKEKIRKSNDV